MAKNKNEIQIAPQEMTRHSLQTLRFFYEETLQPLMTEFDAIEQNEKIKPKQKKQEFKKSFQKSRLKYYLLSVALEKNAYNKLDDLTEILSQVDEKHRAKLFDCFKWLQRSRCGWSGYTTTDFYYRLTKTDTYLQAQSDDPVRLFTNQIAALPLLDDFSAEFINNVTVKQVFTPLYEAFKKVVNECGGITKFLSLKMDPIITPLKEFLENSQRVTLQYYLSAIYKAIKRSYLIPGIIQITWGRIFQMATTEFYQDLKKDNHIIVHNDEEFIISIKVEVINQRFDSEQPVCTVLKFVHQPGIHLIQIKGSESKAVFSKLASSLKRAFPLTHMEYGQKIFPTSVIARVAYLTTTEGLGGTSEQFIRDEKKSKSWEKIKTKETLKIIEKLNQGELMAVFELQFPDESDRERTMYFQALKEYFRAVLLYPTQYFLNTLNVTYIKQHETFSFGMFQSIAEHCANSFILNAKAQQILIIAVLCIGHEHCVSTQDLDIKSLEKIKLSATTEESESDMLHLLCRALVKKSAQFVSVKMKIEEIIGTVLLNEQQTTLLKMKLTTYFERPLDYYIEKSLSCIGELYEVVDSLKDFSSKQKSNLKIKLTDVSELFKEFADVHVIKELIQIILRSSEKNIEILFNKKIDFHFHQDAEQGKKQQYSLKDFAIELGLIKLIRSCFEELSPKESKKESKFMSRFFLLKDGHQTSHSSQEDITLDTLTKSESSGVFESEETKTQAATPPSSPKGSSNFKI